MHSHLTFIGVHETLSPPTKKTKCKNTIYYVLQHVICVIITVHVHTYIHTYQGVIKDFIFGRKYAQQGVWGHSPPGAEGYMHY